MRLSLTLALAAALCVGTAGAATSPAPRATLKPFASEAEFDELIARWREAARSRQDLRRAEAVGGALSMAAPAAPQTATKAMADNAAGKDAVPRFPACGVKLHTDSGLIRNVRASSAGIRPLPP